MPLFDLNFLGEPAAGAAGSSDRRHWLPDLLSSALEPCP
jgi:hypothetical protein